MIRLATITVLCLAAFMLGCQQPVSREVRSTAPVGHELSLYSVETSVPVEAAEDGDLLLAYFAPGRLARIRDSADTKPDLALGRIELDGSVQWSNRFPSDRRPRVSELAVDDSGNVYLCGWSNGPLPGQAANVGSGGGHNGFVICVDSAGRLRWTYRYVTPTRDCVQAALGLRDGVLIAGVTTLAEPVPPPAGGSSPDRREIFVVHLRGDGVVRWERRTNVVSNEIVRDIVVDEDDRVWLCGRTWPSTGFSQAFVACIGDEASTTHVHVFGDPETQTEARVLLVDRHGVAVAGQWYARDTDPDGKQAHAHLTMLPTGESEWITTRFGASDVRGMVRADDGGVILSGPSRRWPVRASYSGAYLAGFDAEGQERWAERLLPEREDLMMTPHTLLAPDSSSLVVGGNLIVFSDGNLRATAIIRVELASE